MKRRILYGITPLFVAILVACNTNDNVAETELRTIPVRDITITTMPIGGAEEDSVSTISTRSIATGSRTRYNIGLQYHDSVGIFPQDGYQIPFALPIPEGQTVNSSVINAQGWSTQQGIIYSVYHPYDFYNRSGDSIFWDYRVIQHQATHDTRDHLGKYWFLASNTVVPTVNEDGTSSFSASLHLMGAILRVQSEVIADADYRRIMFVADDTLFATHGVYKLFDETGGSVNLSNLNSIPIPCTYQPFHAKGHTDHVTLDISSAQRSAGDVLTCYIAIPETDLTGHHVYLYLWDSNNNLYVGDYSIPANDKSEGYFSRNAIRSVLFDNMRSTTTLDVKLNDWEKEELCPTCTPVAW